MKLVIAVIQPTKLDSVRDALEKLNVTRMTVCDAQGFGRQRGQMTETPDTDSEPKVLRKVALEVTVNDDFIERTVDTIMRVARSGPDGAIGDGKIFVVPSEEAVQIDDGARGPGAV
ncbi:MAG: P-II family nitrogen regulator [Candidatus Nealsonbacteria bacterium]|nr:P-II family nitrogen regulator [Candidatus Nealsonbacteria bacterium]